MAARPPLRAKRLARKALSSIERLLPIISRSRANARRGSARIPDGGTKRLGIEGGSAAPPLVDTVTVNGAGAPFAIDTLAGTWHVASSGAPVQASDTVPL